MSWVRGTHTYTNSTAPVTLMLNVDAGDALILSVCTASQNIYGFLDNGSVIDDQGNIWELVCTSPSQHQDDSFITTQIITYIALNCAGGSTTVTVAGSAASNTGYLLDEYSNVAAIRAVDGISFNAVQVNSSPFPLFVSTGNISINGTELVYSVGFADLEGETLSASAGFTQRQLQNNALPLSCASFDTSVTGGSISNTISISNMPQSGLHVVAFALASTPVSSTIVQKGYATLGVISGQILNIPFPRPTQAGNLLILVARTYERGGFIIEDSQNNDWVLFQYPNNTGPSLLMAYALHAKAGANIVTINGTTGGDDVAYTVMVAEYDQTGAQFIASSFGNSDFQNTVNTGNIVSSANTLLISGLVVESNTENISPEPPIQNLETWRWQISDPGFFNEYCAVVTLADSVVSNPGIVSNTFTLLSSANGLSTGILGFSIPPENCFLVDFPITGTFKNLDGSPLSYGTLSIRLVFDCNCPCADYQITGNNHVMIPLDVNGVVMGTTKLRPNNQLQPSGSYYILQAYSESGQLVFGPKILVV